MKITIEDVARQAGVSKATVSRILNGNYSQSTPETREKVLKIIKKLDYQPNALAKGLKQMKTQTIGIVLSNLQNPFWARVLEGVEDACQTKGYSLMICNANDDPALEEKHIRGLKQRQVDGVLINPIYQNQELYENLANSDYPIVFVNRKIDGVPVNMVLMDNIKGTREGIQHFINLGKKNIAFFVYPPEGVSPRIERMESYKQTLIDNGISVKDKWIQVVEEKKGAAKHRVQEIIRDSDQPDAIFSTNNEMTLELMEGIKEMGRVIPKDIALIGYDETVWSMHLDPPLTTIKQPAYEMGELAAQRLIKLIESKRKVKPKIEILEPHLIIRKSCGAK